MEGPAQPTLSRRNSVRSNTGNRVVHSHWSRSIQILCSDWLRAWYCYAQLSYAIKTLLISCLDVFSFGIRIGGFHARKDVIVRQRDRRVGPGVDHSASGSRRQSVDSEAGLEQGRVETSHWSGSSRYCALIG